MPSGLGSFLCCEVGVSTRGEEQCKVVFFENRKWFALLFASWRSVFELRLTNVVACVAWPSRGGERVALPSPLPWRAELRRLPMKRQYISETKTEQSAFCVAFTECHILNGSRSRVSTVIVYSTIHVIASLLRSRSGAPAGETLGPLLDDKERVSFLRNVSHSFINSKCGRQSTVRRNWPVRN